MAEDYGLSLRVGMLLMAEDIAHSETDADRLQRMRAALDRLWPQLAQEYRDQTTGLTLPGDAVRLVPGFDSREQALRYLIELAFSNPFTPNEHKVFPNPRWLGVERIGRELPVIASAVAIEVKGLRKAYEAVQASQKPIPWERMAVGAVGLVVTGLVLTPAAAVWLGATGLSGAAAITSMLATLGSGAIAAGGLGMAGGLWVLAGASALVGSTTAISAAQTLKALGSAHATVEIMKLQVSFKSIRLDSAPPDYPSAFKDIQTLAERIEEFRALVEEERGLNVKGAQRVKEMEETLEAMVRALTWMKKEAVAK